MTRSTHVALFHGPGQALETRKFPIPKLHSGELLVRIVGCTLCGSDLHTIAGRRSVASPMILGHETLGVIEDWGVNSIPCDFYGQRLQRGDRVTWAIVAHCGDCFYCQHQLPQKCEQGHKFGHRHFESIGDEVTASSLFGGLAEHCILPRTTAIFRVPEHLSNEVACPANCATATVHAALSTVGDLSGQRVLILGMGLLGLTASAMSAWLGADEIVACDLDTERLTIAQGFGAEHVTLPADLEAHVKQITSGYGYDVALDFTGSPALCAQALRCLRIGGRLVLVGAVFPGDAMPLMLEDVVRRQLTIQGIHNYAPYNLGEAIRFLVANRQYPFADLFGGWFDLSCVEQAIQFARDKRPIRIGVRYDKPVG